MGQAKKRDSLSSDQSSAREFSAKNFRRSASTNFQHRRRRPAGSGMTLLNDIMRRHQRIEMDDQGINHDAEAAGT